MFKSKMILRLTGLLVASVALTALGVQPLKAQTLQFATAFPETDFSSQLVKRWTDGVTEKTNGRIKFRIHWAGSLVGNKMVDGMKDGVVDAALSFTPYVSGEIIDLAPLDVPFSFPMDSEGLASFNRAAVPILDAIYQKRGSRVVAAPPVLLPDPVTCSKDFVSSADKWKGVKIRTAGRWQAETIKRWGGSPVVMAISDVYTGLNLGTVDCTLMIYNGVLSLKLFEPAKFITRVDHSVAFGTFNVANTVWNRLSEADRKVMLNVGQEVMDWGIAEYAKTFVTTLDRLVAAGAQMCVPKQAEFDRLVAAANDVFKVEIEPKVTPDGKRLIELIGTYRDRVVARPSVGPMRECP
jgi:TRAP-type C4-dicarboxylate transport system substrate-binding protein